MKTRNGTKNRRGMICRGQGVVEGMNDGREESVGNKRVIIYETGPRFCGDAVEHTMKRMNASGRRNEMENGVDGNGTRCWNKDLSREAVSDKSRPVGKL